MDPSFFGLSEHPFAKTDNLETPCLAEEHLALSAELNAGLKAPHGITLLIGEQGAGKTTFVRNFLAQLPDSFVVAYLPTAGPGLRHLLTEIIEQLGGTVAAGGQEQALIDTLRSLAKARAEHDRATLIVIDDAHELPAKTIERLGKLFGTDAADPSRLHITLVGRPELLDRMNAANDRSILKHLVQVCRMDAIGPEDAFRYIADRVQRVGGMVDRLFSEDALRLIVQRANGNPARIDQLCSAALERAAGRGISLVDASAVEAASSGAGAESVTGANVPNDESETPTYFFNEDEENQRAAEGMQTVPVEHRALSREGAAVAVPASRQRLIYWAVGAIAIAGLVAWFMVGGELPIGASQPELVAKGPARLSAAEKAGPAEVDSAASEKPATEEAGGVPKLVVKRGAKGAAGERSPEARDSEKLAGAAAEPAAAAVPDRPRFPAPPPPSATPEPGTPVAAEAAADAEALPTAVPPKPAAGAEKPLAEPPAAAPPSAPPKPQVPAPVAAAAPAAAKAEMPPAPATAPAEPQAKAAPAPVPPSRPAVAPKPTVAPPAPVQSAAARPAAGRFTVQLGAFSSRANAEALLAKARNVASDGRIVASSAGGKPVFRVVAGSFATQAEANTHAAALKKNGYTGFVKKLD
jgi:type II secretory pathway predicted ATPase ExeA